jgi:aspartate/methionine/tyrosine aminotransferase
MAFLNEGDEVLIPNPGYPTYSSVTNLVGAVPIYYNLTESSSWEPDLNTRKIRFVKGEVDVDGYPHIPTGARGSLNLFEKISGFCQEVSNSIGQ